MFCEQCGANLESGATFCQSCGSKVEVKETGSFDASLSKEATSSPNSTPVIPVTTPNQGYNSGYSQSLPVSDQDAPLSVGTYVGMLLINFLPIVNVIIYLVWALGSDVNKNKKNFSIAMLIFIGISVALSIILTVMLGFMMAAFATEFLENPGLYY